MIFSMCNLIRESHQDDEQWGLVPLAVSPRSSDLLARRAESKNHETSRRSRPDQCDDLYSRVKRLLARLLMTLEKKITQGHELDGLLTESLR